MLHILWMVIKVILIIFGILLGLLLLALLLILFCPVRYRASAVKGSEPVRMAKASVCVSWLFEGIRVKLMMENGARKWDVRLFGIPILRFLEKRKKKKRSVKASSAKSESHKEASKKEEQAPRIETSEAPHLDAPQPTEEISRTEPEPLQPQPEESESEESRMEESRPEESQPEESRTKQPEKKQSIGEKLGYKFHALWEKLKNIPRRIVEPIKKVSSAIRSIFAKIDWWKQFLCHPRTQEALSFVKKETARLIRHVFPTRIRGKITFGTEDPSVTGTVLALLGMTIPFHKNRIKVCPAFEGVNMFEGNVQLKGRVYGIVLLKAALEIYFNKNIKYVIYRWKHKEG